MVKDKLLVIELESLDDVPKIFYRGNRIENMVLVNFKWETDTEKHGEKKIELSYFDEKERVVKGIVEVKP